tara:strand:- start:112 stop:762 length:651 start_codon:yes stop_codon:yes gene_type:complete
MTSEIMALSEFSARLNKILDLRNYPAKDKGRIVVFAKKAGVTPKAVSKWLNSESLPSRKNRERICDLEDINIEWLETGNGVISTEKTTDQRIFPILSIEESPNHNNLVRSSPKHSFEITHVINDKSFVIYASEDSMSPVFDKGSILFIDPDQKDLVDGKFYLIHTKEEKSTVIRQCVIASNNNVFFTAFNSEYSPIQYSSKNTVIGKVVYSISRYA